MNRICAAALLAAGITTMIVAPAGGQTVVPENGAGMKLAEPTEAFIGRDIVDGGGDVLGHVEQIVGDDLVVRVGGFLGFGEMRVLLPWERVRTDRQNGEFKLVVDMTEAQLKALPEYEKPSGDREFPPLIPRENGER